MAPFCLQDATYITTIAVDTTLIRRRARIALLNWLPLALWMALIYWVSDQPVLPRPGRRVGISDDLFNYMAHALEYAILGWLALRVLQSSPRVLVGVLAAAERQVLDPEKRRLLVSLCAALFSALYAITDEVHQVFVPGRTAKVLDWLADVGGALVAIGLLWLWNRRAARIGAGRELNDL